MIERSSKFILTNRLLYECIIIMDRYCYHPYTYMYMYSYLYMYILTLNNYAITVYHNYMVITM